MIVKSMATNFFDILLQSRSQLSTPFEFECLMTDSFAQKGLVEVKLFDFLDKVTNATPIPASGTFTFFGSLNLKQLLSLQATKNGHI